MADTVEDRKEIEGQQGGEAKFWQLQLDLSDKDHKDFLEEGEAVLKRYKTEKKRAGANARRINILYSNTETLKSSIYARQAKPDVRRRFADQDPIGRQVAEILERSLSYCNDQYDADDPIEAGIEDYLLPGRGVVRVDYEPTIKAGEVTDQTVTEKYVYWKDFRHEPARKWSKVTWIAYRWLFSREDLVENFNDKGQKCPLNWSPDPDNKKLPDLFKRAEVWEVWDKSKRKRYWVCKGFPEILRTDDDPYGLEKFFNVARPLFATTTNETVIPEAEFYSYRDQADGLDEIENRIDRLTRALKRRGVYDATIKELEGLRNAQDNQFIPVKSYAEFAQKGGLEAAFQTEDISKLAQVLKELHVQRDLRIQAIYEITGISDIFRGATDPNETLGAQELKANFGGARLKKRQDKIQKWIRDTYRIKAELIAEHFAPEKLQQMTGVTLVPPQAPQPTGNPEQDQQALAQYKQAVATGQQIVKTLQSDKLRSCRVDVETDSTVFEDAQAEKAARTELLKAMSEFVVAWLPVLQAKPELLQMAFEMLAFGIRGFKAGRQLEDVIEQTKLKLQQAAQQPPPPDPKVEAEKVKAEAAKQKAELDAQAQQAKVQGEQQKMAMELQAAQQKHQMELEKMRAEMQMQAAELQMMQQKLGLEAEAMQIKASMEAQAMERHAAHEERSAELAGEQMERKHEIGLETMEAKAKQAKQKPNGRR